jgi:tetratricopeptide (TPR) repeat protein
MRPHALIATLALASAAFASPQFDAARELYQQRKDAEAREAFTALAKAEPKNAEVPFYLGRLAMRAKNAEAAASLFEEAIALDGTKAAYYVELGGAYGNLAQNAGLLGKASFAGKTRKALEKAVELDPKNFEARNGLVQFYSQAPGFMGGGMDKAYAQVEEMIKIDAFRGNVAKAGLLVTEKKYDEAFAIYEGALKDHPDDYAALFQFGRLAAITGQRLDRGIESLKRCLAMTPPTGQPPHAAAHWRIGNIWEKKGDKAAARAAYEAALTADPKFQQAIDSLKKLG